MINHQWSIPWHPSPLSKVTYFSGSIPGRPGHTWQKGWKTQQQFQRTRRWASFVGWLVRQIWTGGCQKLPVSQWKDAAAYGTFVWGSYTSLSGPYQQVRTQPLDVHKCKCKFCRLRYVYVCVGIVHFSIGAVHLCSYISGWWQWRLPTWSCQGMSGFLWWRAAGQSRKREGQDKVHQHSPQKAGCHLHVQVSGEQQQQQTMIYMNYHFFSTCYLCLYRHADMLLDCLKADIAGIYGVPGGDKSPLMPKDPLSFRGYVLYMATRGMYEKCTIPIWICTNPVQMCVRYRTFYLQEIGWSTSSWKCSGWCGGCR